MFKHKCGKRILNNQSTNEDSLSWIPETIGSTVINEPDQNGTTLEESNEKPANTQSENYLSIPSTIATSNSLDTLTESTLSGPSSPSNLSSVTLVGSTGSGGQDKTEATSPNDDTKEFYGTAPTAPLPERKPKPPPLKNIEPVKEGILTYSLPPTVTTTHYVETQSTTTPTKKVNGEHQQSHTTPTKFFNHSSTLGLQPHGKTIMDRRPSAGANIIPHAALCQHRHSLQLNGDASSLTKVCFFFTYNLY